MTQDLITDTLEFRELRNELREKIKSLATYDQVVCGVHKLLHKVYDSADLMKNAS